MDLSDSQNKATAEANSGETEKNKAEAQGEDSRSASSPMELTGGQLTIFYNGSTSVYNGVTPEKAQAIMLIAAASAVSKTSANKILGVAVSPNSTALTRCLSQQSSSAAAAAGGNANSLCKLQADLPIARRQSLQQFLEKRRNRLVSKAPYAPAKKMEEGVEVAVEGKPQPQPQLN